MGLDSNNEGQFIEQCHAEFMMKRMNNFFEQEQVNAYYHYYDLQPFNTKWLPQQFHQPNLI